jgi:hypothetical protein
MSVPNEKTVSGLASPSNLALAALVGFLFVGTVTDWTMLHGRASKSRKSSLTGRAGASANNRLRQIPPGASKSDPFSDVADRRNSLHEMQTNRREIE